MLKVEIYLLLTEQCWHTNLFKSHYKIKLIHLNQILTNSSKKALILYVYNNTDHNDGVICAVVQRSICVILEHRWDRAALEYFYNS